MLWVQSRREVQKDVQLLYVSLTLSQVTSNKNLNRSAVLNCRKELRRKQTVTLTYVITYCTTVYCTNDNLNYCSVFSVICILWRYPTVFDVYWLYLISYEFNKFNYVVVERWWNFGWLCWVLMTICGCCVDPMKERVADEELEHLWLGGS